MFPRIRKIFLTGLLVSLPLVVTVVVFKFVFDTLDNILGPMVTQLLVEAGAPIRPTYKIPGVGVVTTLALVFLIGLFTRHWIGRKLWDVGENIVSRIPLIRPVYIGAKQVVDTFAANSSHTFSKVVMLEYPRRGIYCLAFITSDTRGEAQERTAENLVNVFLPTTPNPTSGFLLLVPREDLIIMDMTVEEGIKMIVSGGIVTPKFGKVIKEKHVAGGEPQGDA
ncbi:MAG: DUF502 domain-containing protein [Candidatus Nitrospinota bacterium M3_3B_026]